MLEDISLQEVFEQVKLYVTDSISTNDFMAAGLIVSLFWKVSDYIINWLKKLYKFASERLHRLVNYEVHIEQTDELFLYFERWLRAHHNTNYRKVIAHIDEGKNIGRDVGHGVARVLKGFGNEKDRYELAEDKLKFRQLDDYFLIWKGIIPIKVKKQRTELKGPTNISNLFFDNFVVEGWFSKKIIDTMIQSAIDYNQQFRKEENLKIKILTGNYGSYDFGELDLRPFKTVIMDTKAKLDLHSDIKQFEQNKQWYELRGIPYRRAYAFIGQPGNGKTSLIKAIASEFDKPIHMLDMGDMKNKDLVSAFSDVKNGGILVIEDIDSYVDGRKKKKHFDFSTLLNCMDGMYSKSGIITIITTNKRECLDEALMRPGRIDYILEINNPSKKVVENYISLFYERRILLDKYRDNSRCMSDIQDVCIRNKNSFVEAKNELETITID